LQKNLKTIKGFIDSSIGEWKSIRSTHSLAFQDFENSNSLLSISYLDLKDHEVQKLINEFNNNFEPLLAIRISWKSVSEWSPDEGTKEENSILIFSPLNIKSGIIFKNKGYSESMKSSSKYFLEKGNLNIINQYHSTISEERIWFLSENVRSRCAVLKNKNAGIIQTSYATEIRKIY
tara:strand:+ start:1847 stop:2377 length:531 start_codon:yes stop_codon:yes gene_type:complete